jgi:hypothetical protein
MRCRRCQGAMVVHHFMDQGDESRSVWVAAWCCGRCGEPEKDGVAPRRRSNRRSRDTMDIVALGT